MRTTIVAAIALLAGGARAYEVLVIDGDAWCGNVPGISVCPPIGGSLRDDMPNTLWCINLPDKAYYDGPLPICPSAAPAAVPDDLDKAMAICRAHETRLIVNGIDTGGYEYGPKWGKVCTSILVKRSDRDAEQEARDLEFVKRIAGDTK